MGRVRWEVWVRRLLTVHPNTHRQCQQQILWLNIPGPSKGCQMDVSGAIKQPQNGFKHHPSEGKVSFQWKIMLIINIPRCSIKMYQMFFHGNLRYPPDATPPKK